MPDFQMPSSFLEHRCAPEFGHKDSVACVWSLEVHLEGNIGEVTYGHFTSFLINKVCAYVVNDDQFEVQKDIKLAVFREALLRHREVEELSAQNGETTMQHTNWMFNDELASLWWQSRCGLLLAQRARF
jgi:hypothetical protein